MSADLAWWEVRDGRDYEVGRVSNFVGMGEGWHRVVELARDARARPHLTASSDHLRLECREMAELLFKVVLEDGHTLTLAECLRTIVLDAAEREPEPHSSTPTEGES